MLCLQQTLPGYGRILRCDCPSPLKNVLIEMFSPHWCFAYVSQLPIKLQPIDFNPLASTTQVNSHVAPSLRKFHVAKSNQLFPH